MKNSLSTFIDILVLLAIGLACLPILIALMPNIEQSVSEARLGQTYIEVKRLHDSVIDQPLDEVTLLQERDPWGEPYRAIRFNNGEVRVWSSGLNRKTSTDGVDDDDIYSDMSYSPIQSTLSRKNRQLLIAIAATIGAWGILSYLYFRYLRKG